MGVVISNTIKSIATSKTISNVAKKYVGSLTKDQMAAKWVIASLVLKDGINCAFYTTQSYNNKKIPESQRKFVAALDLSNGMMNVVSQLLMAKCLTTEKTKKWMENKIIGRFINDDAKNALFKKIQNNEFLKSKVPDAQKLEETFTKYWDRHVIATKAGLEFLTITVGASIFCKRVITPLIATPIAFHLKELMEKKSGKAQDDKTGVNMQLPSTPISPEKSGTDRIAAMQKLVKTSK